MSDTAPPQTARPSLWLLILTLAVVAVFTMLRVLMAAQLDLRSDEAYYWTWSHQSVLSFLDQPPMVAWFERLGELAFGDTPLGARFAQVLALPLIEILLADIARRRTRQWNAALFVVLALECALYYGQFVIVIEPSIPLLLFTSLLLWSLCRLDETMDARWWLLIGVAGGLALLSKYIVLLLVPALLVFLLVSPRHRSWPTSLWPYVAIAIALLIFSPVLLWNARHDWASFAFQGARLGQGHAMGLGDLIRFAVVDTFCVGLVLTYAAIIGSVVLGVRALRTGNAYEAAIATAFIFPFGFFVVRSLSLQINQSWAYFMWPLGILGLALALPWETARRRIAVLIAGVALTGLPVVAGLFFHVLADNSVWLGRGDPFGQDAGFGDMADKVLADAKVNGATWIATTEYRTYANLLWHIGGQIPVVQVNERARFLDFAPLDPKQFEGKGLYVHLAAKSPVLVDARLTPLEAMPVTWRGEIMQNIQVDTLENFAPELNPSLGSVAYRWGE